MADWAAFLRGINVGGHRRLPMADLRSLVAQTLEAQNVRTLVASGNVLFSASSTAAGIAEQIEKAIEEKFGFEVPTLVLYAGDLRTLVDGCPFANEPPKTVHGFLCFDDPAPDWSRVSALRRDSETLTQVGRTLWLHAPEGIGRSRLAAQLDPGVPVTARNLNTLSKMVDLLADHA